MCKFCDTLKEGKDIELFYRTCSSLDNFCEYVNGNDCSLCNECSTKFIIHPISGRNKDEMYVNIKFKDKATNINKEDVVIDKNSECFNIIYCPMCGKKLSKEGFENLDELMYPFEELKEE